MNLQREPTTYKIVNILTLPSHQSPKQTLMSCPEISPLIIIPPIIDQHYKWSLEELPDELGKLIATDILFKEHGWKGMVVHFRPGDDFSTLNIKHPSHCLLNQYKKIGVPMVTNDAPWSHQRISEALSRGAHKSCHEYEKNIREEFTSIHHKQQWIVLSYDVIKDILDCD